MVVEPPLRTTIMTILKLPEEWMRVKQSQNGCPKQSQNGCPNMTSLMHLVVAHGSPG